MKNVHKKTKSTSQKVIRHYSFLKGIMAEGLVDRLFTMLGYEIYPVGVEKTLPRHAYFLRKGKLKQSAIQRYEYGPDFAVLKDDISVVHNYLLEVKYRANGKISLKDLEPYQDEEMIFIFISDGKFYTLLNGDKEKICDKNKVLLFSNCERLKDSKLFNFTPLERQEILVYEEYITVLLSKLESEKVVMNKMNNLSKTLQVQLVKVFNKL